jgi:hypothetical protein
MKKPLVEPVSVEKAVEDIRNCHRRRRYAMKVQQKIDRALESFVRINSTDWSFDADEAEREKYNRQVAAIISAARKGEGAAAIVGLVRVTDVGREPFDDVRTDNEGEMEKLAAGLPVASWVASVRGAGNLGVATIVAEAGDLSNYPSPAHLWSRLGFAPYQGFAGSTWKRETWRPRALTKEEWTAHPFSGQRYGLMHQIAIWLVNAQWIAAGKSEDGEGKPNGPYGQIYYDRRQHTLGTHPDWSKMHRRMDALRVTMKAFLKDLWCEWNGKPKTKAFEFDETRAAAPPIVPPAKRKRGRAADHDERPAP